MRHLVVWTVFLTALAGCGRAPSLREIETEKSNLEGLYISADTGKVISAPINRGVFVDEETGEICFPAYTCTNPDCPGEGEGDRPFLFIHRDVLMEVGSDGEITYRDIPEGTPPKKYIESLGGHQVPTCPACLEKRNLAAETDADRAKYANFAQPYIPPETLKRQAELEELYQKRRAEIRKERRGTPE
jgi:hypothetical protein